MTDTAGRNPHQTERGFDRLVNFSDAVVAIAITLLVLPLTDLVSDAVGDASGKVDLEGNNAGAFTLLQQNSAAFSAFALTFLVTAMFWLIHHRIFEYIGDYDSYLSWMNMAWLMLIVLLPFLSGLLEQDGFENGTGLLYCWCLAGLSGLLSLISLHVQRNPYLLAQHASPNDMRSGHRGWAFGGYLFMLGLLSLVAPVFAQYAMFGLLFLGKIVGSRNPPDSSEMTSDGSDLSGTETNRSSE